MYEVMAYWETAHTPVDQPSHILDYAEIWQAADKIVFSTTLTEPSSERTRIERTFEPDVVRQIKESADANLSVGGPTLAGQAIRAGLVDEFHLFVAPAVVGGGTRFLPDGVRLSLRLEEERGFANGMVYIRYGLIVDATPSV
jgi:dihydrofolate reductase